MISGTSIMSEKESMDVLSGNIIIVIIHGEYFESWPPRQISFPLWSIDE
jgi:hypothetical protein